MGKEYVTFGLFKNMLCF